MYQRNTLHRRILFASYLLMTVVVLINLLIAMMSDTYQRIQQQSDIEWKFGLAKLIRNMQRTQVAPSPLNLVSTWIVLTHTWYVLYLLNIDRFCNRDDKENGNLLQF